MRFLLTLVFTLLFISGCCSCRKGSPVIGNLETNVWTLKELDDTLVTTDFKITFDARSKVLRGDSVYSGYHLYDRETNNIEFLQPGYHGNNSLHHRMVDILRSTVTVKIDGGHLLFINSENTVLAIFK